jgi:hypothetical protein
VRHDPVLADELLERLMRPQFDVALDARVVMETLYGAVFHRWLLRTVPFEDDDVERLLAVVLPEGR